MISAIQNQSNCQYNYTDDLEACRVRPRKASVQRTRYSCIPNLIWLHSTFPPRRLFGQPPKQVLIFISVKI